MGDRGELGGCWLRRACHIEGAPETLSAFIYFGADCRDRIGLGSLEGCCLTLKKPAR